jgi:hypothetical protein
MHLFFKLACLTLMPVLGHFTIAQAPEPAPSATFPVVVSYDLNKVKVTLPGDLKGDVNLLLLPFEREQQADADSWLPLAKEVETAHPGLRHYMLPVFGRENFLYRWWINSSMRSDAKDDQERQSTIPLYLNRPTFLKQLKIASDTHVTVLLVKKDGDVIWRSTGAMTAEKRASLETVLAPSGKTGR